MKKLLVIVGGILVVAAILAAWWARTRPPEVFYRGKPLTFWFTKYVPVAGGPSTDDIVRAVGTNSIPTILRMLRLKDSKVTTRLIHILRQQPFIKIRHRDASKINGLAADGFRVLGPLASHAVPDLVGILDEHISYDSQTATIQALAGIGPAAESAIPSLLRIVGGTNNLLRGEACSALGQIHRKPEIVVPLLIKCLHEPSIFVRNPAASALGLYGADARSAFPALVDCLDDQDAGVRKRAESSLKQIDSGAADKIRRIGGTH